MKISTLIEWFEDWANPVWQESWDNCGWQVEPGVLEEPARVLVCLTPTIEVMQEAITLRDAGVLVNLIFAHHPLIFKSLKSLQVGEPITEILRLAFTHHIGIYSAHTNFDQVRDGTADVLAQILELKYVRPMVVTQDERGYGRIGDIEPACTVQEFLANIKSHLSPPDLIFSPVNLERRIKRVAVLGGSGASFIDTAVQLGAQAYLTSDCKFHQFQESSNHDLILIDAGHYATERPACTRLVEKFKSLGLEFAELSIKDKDFRQFYSQNLKN